MASIAAEHPSLETALNMAAQEPQDETAWLLAARRTVFTLMGLRLRPGEDDGGIFADMAPPRDPRAATGPPNEGSGDTPDKGGGRSGPGDLGAVNSVALPTPGFHDVPSVLDEIARSIDGACDDENECTTDTCDGSTGDCIHEPLSGMCTDDGNQCTHDFCSNGVCIHPLKNCDDQDP